jgi:hypothetical protein
MLRIIVQKNLFSLNRIPHIVSYIVSHRNCTTITDTVKNAEKEAAHKKLVTLNFITWLEKGFPKKENLDYFIELGADVTINDNYALILACEAGDVEMVKRLELSGANIKSVEEKLLRIASSAGHLDVLKYLVYRSNVCTSNNQPLILACRNGHLNAVKFLIENGVGTCGTNDCLKVATDEKVIEYLEKLEPEKNSFHRDILIFTGYFAVSGGALIGLGLIGYGIGVTMNGAIDYFYFKE